MNRAGRLLEHVPKSQGLSGLQFCRRLHDLGLHLGFKRLHELNEIGFVRKAIFHPCQDLVTVQAGHFASHGGHEKVRVFFICAHDVFSLMNDVGTQKNQKNAQLTPGRTRHAFPW